MPPTHAPERPAIAPSRGEGDADRDPATAPAMRLVLVTETYPPEVNGVAMTVARLVDGLRARGHPLQLVRPRQRGDACGVAATAADGFHEVLLRGLPIPRYPQLKMGLPAGRALARRWKWQRPDLVHIATEGPLGWSALQAALQLGLPVTSDFRTNFHAYSQHYGIGWLQRPIMAYLRTFHNRAHCTMVPTEALRKTLADEGLRNVAVVARGVDTQLFTPERRSAPLRASWGAGPQTRVVACVGRLAPEKNLDLLLRAFDAMLERQPDCRLLLVGDGPLRAALQARCPQAVFAGNRSGDDLAAHYASADAFVFASVTETFGNVTAEAMASGLPVLAFDYAAAGRLIQHRANGLVVPLHDNDRFVAQAQWLVQQTDRGAALGHAARQTALAQPWHGVVAQVETLMRAALAHPRPTPFTALSPG
ncbi:MAG: glycosyltransferase family 1 protein [Microbacteriaceae bacterium]|nr:glycosyltransferase family 1 protein [Burkholderiaceae bacterium]